MIYTVEEHRNLSRDKQVEFSESFVIDTRRKDKYGYTLNEHQLVFANNKGAYEEIEKWFAATHKSDQFPFWKLDGIKYQ